MNTPLSPSPSRIPSFVRPFYEFLFPPACFACNRALISGEDIVCQRCWSTVQSAHREDPVYRETLQRLTEPGPLTDLIAVYYFAKDGVLQKLLHQLKYEGMTRLGEVLGRQVGILVSRRMAQKQDSVLIPVPLHRTKRRERGFNQSEWICRGISAVSGLTADRTMLRRTRSTRSQTGLRIDERRENVGGAFGLDPSAAQDLRGRSFLLVDDVVTTGSTLEACAAVLRAHGARSVAAAAVALAI